MEISRPAWNRGFHWFGDFFEDHRVRFGLLANLVCMLLPAFGVAQDGTRPVTPGASRSNQIDEESEILQAPHPTAIRNSVLTLADAETVAMNNNPSLVVAASRVELARGRWVQAGLYPNPVVGYHATEIGNLGRAGQQGAFVNQRFITGGKRKLDRDVAVREVEQARFEFEAQRTRVLSDVRVRFYDALVAQRRVELTKGLADIGEESVKASATLLEARRVSENALLQAEIEAESAHILYDNSQNELRESWRRLAAVMGTPRMVQARLHGALESGVPQCQWEECLAGLMTQSPELAAAAMRVERARFAVTRAGRSWIPDVDIGVSVRHHNVTTDDVANVQVGIPIPVFDAGQGKVRQANSELVAAQHAVRQLELDLQDRLAVAFRRYSNARQQVGRYSQRILPRARKSLELVTTGYRERQTDYLTLLTTQQTFVRVSLAHLDALRELREASTLIEGQLLSGSLLRIR